MGDEAETGPTGAPDGGGHPRGSPGEQSPLQTRAQFLKNWRWESVIGHNRGACARGGAQHGFNRETQGPCEKDWEAARESEASLIEAFDRLRSFHRRAPFLFFNGNTFADIGRQIATALFADLPTVRRREVASVVAHYIAGVLDREAMIEIIESLCTSAQFKPGDQVKTLRGTTRGKIVRLLDDGRVVWQPSGSSSELIALPESLLPAQ